MGKQGVPAFLLDTHLDEKWELLEARFGLKGFAIAVKLLQRIYGGEGYYCEWNDDVGLVFARSVGASASLVSEIVDFMVKRELFDKQLGSLGILTSTSIQKRYLQIKRRATEVVLEGSFLCTQILEDVYKKQDSVYKNVKIVYEKSISKVNESKVNDISNDISSEAAENDFADNLTNTSQEPCNEPLVELILKNGSTHALCQKDLDYYRGIYPNINVLQEFKKMSAWLSANPNNRKTSSGIKRFINGWLSRSQAPSEKRGNKRVAPMPQYENDTSQVTKMSESQRNELLKQLQNLEE